MLKGILESDVEKKAVLQLRGTDAGHFLYLIYDVHAVLPTLLLILLICSPQVFDKHPSDLGDDAELFLKKAHRLTVKLHMTCGMLPPSLIITGVKDCNKAVVSGGGFADVFHASYRGKMVALKCLRDYQLNKRHVKTYQVRGT